MSAAAEARETVLEVFQRRGLTEAEVYVQDIRQESMAVSGGQVEAVENKELRGASVRIIRDGHLGFAYSAALDPESLARMVERASEAAIHVAVDADRRLPPPDSPPDVEGNVDPSLARAAASTKVELALRAEAAARGHDRRVRSTRESRYQDVDGQVLLGRADGYRYDYRFTRAFLFVDLVAADGDDSQSGVHLEFALGPGGLDPEAVGREAARRAARKLGGRPCSTRRVPLLLAPDVVDGLLEALSPVFHGDSVLKGKSFLAGRVGAVVGGARLSLLDDGRLTGGCNTAPVDGEGVATRETTLVEDGVLRGFLHDGYSARRMGEPLTGNAVRDSFVSPPRTEATALRLRPTGERLPDLMAAVTDGLLIDEVMGLHTINPVSGDFSVGAAGRAVRGGEPREAVAGIGIAGNVRDLLGAVAAVADDVRLMASGNAAATVLLEGLSVSGEGR